jgi:hypothetical protein
LPSSLGLGMQTEDRIGHSNTMLHGRNRARTGEAHVLPTPNFRLLKSGTSPT